MNYSPVQAKAANNPGVNYESLKHSLDKGYQILESRLEQEQRCVDRKFEVISAPDATPGEVHEIQRQESLIDTHEHNTDATIDTAAVDSKLDSIEKYPALRDRDIRAHFQTPEETQLGAGPKKGVFTKDAFTYNAATDTFTCPAGQTLKRRKFYKKRQHYEYVAPAGTCSSCQFKRQCTKA